MDEEDTNASSEVARLRKELEETKDTLLQTRLRVKEFVATAMAKQNAQAYTIDILEKRLDELLTKQDPGCVSI